MGAILYHHLVRSVYMYYHVSQVVLGCESAAFGMRKCHFVDAKVPLWGYENGCLGFDMALEDDVFGTFARHTLSALEEKTGNKAGAADYRNGVWGTKSAV